MSNQDWLDEILAKIAIEKTESFDKVKVKIVGKAEAKAAITTKIAEARIEELEWLLDPAHAHISTRERLKALKGDK